jgi:hypothetical protein
MGLSLTPFRANLVLKQLGDLRDWERALLLVKWMEGQAEHPPRTDTYAKLFGILSEAGEYNKVRLSLEVYAGKNTLIVCHLKA